VDIGRDTAKEFEKLNAGLVPAAETIRAVIVAVPKGESWRRGQRANVGLMRPKPTPITYTGEAAAWPTDFARHESLPDHWNEAGTWFFWVVVTDEQLHVFEGHNTEKGWGHEPKAGPESAHFPLDRISEITFDKGMISQLAIWFQDGSCVELEAGMQKFEAFTSAIRPFVRADSQRPKSSGWMRPLWLWALGLALLIGGMAVSVGSSEDGSTVLLVIGIVATVLGTAVVLRAWRASEWKARRAGIPIALIGAFMAAASFSENCDCGQLLYFSVALVMIGGVAQFAPRR
jgi:hypothetical protein